MEMTTPQRVDVGRLPATWRENSGYEMHGLEWDLGYRQALQTCATELEAALPTLLLQLAEAERAREEAEQVVMALVEMWRKDESILPAGYFADELSAAFLAANGGRDHA